MPPQKQRGRLGRSVAIAVYAIAVGYLVIVGFASVIPQVFWPEEDASFDVGCDEGLHVLYEELDRMRLDVLSSNLVERASLRERLRPWDLRMNALRSRCDESKVNLLNKYRYRVELNLERYMRDEAPLAKRVADSLGEAVPTHPTEATR